MLCRTRQILNKKKDIIAVLVFVSILLIAFSPLVSAVTQVNQESPTNTVNNYEYSLKAVDSATEINPVATTATASSSIVPVNIASAETISNLHCLAVLQGDDCSSVVCCPTLAHINSLGLVHPTNETHSVHVSNSYYLVSLPTEVKPPKLSFV